MKFATKPIRHYLPYLRHVATLHRKLKMQIFCTYGRKCKQLHFKCTDFNSSTRVTVYSKCIYVFLSKSCSHR